MHDVGVFSGSARVLLAGLIVLFGMAPRLLSDVIAPYAKELLEMMMQLLPEFTALGALLLLFLVTLGNN